MYISTSQYRPTILLRPKISSATLTCLSLTGSLNLITSSPVLGGYATYPISPYQPEQMHSICSSTQQILVYILVSLWSYSKPILPREPRNTQSSCYYKVCGPLPLLVHSAPEKTPPCDPKQCVMSFSPGFKYI